MSRVALVMLLVVTFFLVGVFSTSIYAQNPTPSQTFSSNARSIIEYINTQLRAKAEGTPTSIFPDFGVVPTVTGRGPRKPTATLVDEVTEEPTERPTATRRVSRTATPSSEEPTNEPDPTQEEVEPTATKKATATQRASIPPEWLEDDVPLVEINPGNASKIKPKFVAVARFAGEKDASELGPNCSGFISEKPQLRLNIAGAVATIGFFSKVWTDGVIVRTPAGKYICSLESQMGYLDPHFSYVDVERVVSGDYFVWAFVPNQGDEEIGGFGFVVA